MLFEGFRRKEKKKRGGKLAEIMKAKSLKHFQVQIKKKPLKKSESR